MKKIWCWFVTGVLSLAPTLTAYGDNNPRIITLDGSFQLGTNYDNDFSNNLFSTDVCQNPTTVQGITAWGGPQYTWIMDYDSDGYKDIVSAYNGWTIVTKRNNYGTGFISASWNYFGWWGPAVNTWALDYSRYSFLNP